MSEDYTWDGTVTDWRKRAMELEHQLATVEHNLVELAKRNAELAALRQRVGELEQELASVREDLCDVLEITIARGDSLGYCDDDYRQWLEELRPESAAITFEVTE